MITLLTLLLWFSTVLALSLSGWIARIHSAILLVAGFVIPCSCFLILYKLSSRVRGFVLSQNLRTITSLQGSRITGIIFFIYYFRGELPGIFAFPTGLSDLSIGLSALFHTTSGFWLRQKSGLPNQRWHHLGIMGLIISGTIGVLTSGPPFGILTAEITSQAMADFPLNLVPTFLGPIILVLHLMALCILGEPESTYSRHHR